MGQVLLGWYEIPSQMGQPVDIIVNPAGMEERSRPRCEEILHYAFAGAQTMIDE